MNNNNRHYCFIINSIDPYCWDLNHILALPSGFVYRNRWLKKWIALDLQNEIKSLQSKRVLLILRDYENDELIPVRWGRIILAQLIGKVYYFEYQLEDIIDYDSDKSARDAQIQAFNKQFIVLLPATTG